MSTLGLEHYQNHFHFVADQRLKLFNIFFVVSVAALGFSLSQLFGENSVNPLAYLVAGIVHIHIGVAFWVFDRRNLGILKLVQQAIIRLEEDEIRDPLLRIFSTELRRRTGKPLLGFVRKLFSMRVVFAWLCALQVFFGLFLVSIGLPHRDDRREHGSAREPSENEPRVEINVHEKRIGTFFKKVNMGESAPIRLVQD